MRKYLKWVLLFFAFLLANAGNPSILKTIGLIVWAVAFVSCVLLTVYKER